MSRILLVSNRRPDPWILESLRRLGYEPSWIVVEKPTASSITWSDLCGIPRDVIGRVDYIIVPGGAALSRAPCRGLEGKVVRGPTSIYSLPDFLEFLSPEDLRLDEPAESAAGERLGRIVMHALSRVRSSSERQCVDRFCVPIRPPPILVFSEIYSGDPAARASAGADLVVVGSGSRSLVEEALDAGAPVGVDSGLDIDFLVWSLDVGAVLGMSLTIDTLNVIPRRLREEKAFVLIPRRLGGPEARVEELRAGLERARELGYSLVILDPVLQPLVNPGSLYGLIAAYTLSGAGAPIMLGINNVYEMIDADTTGSIPVLASLAAEAGVSVLLVSEESRKAQGATMEARIAADMASLALAWRTTPKNLGLALLAWKEKRPRAW